MLPSQILDCVIEPMLQMCSLSAVNLPDIDMAVYMINCIYTMHSLLSLYEYTDKKLEKLEAQVSNQALLLLKIRFFYLISGFNV